MLNGCFVEIGVFLLAWLLARALWYGLQRLTAVLRGVD